MDSIQRVEAPAPIYVDDDDDARKRNGNAQDENPDRHLSHIKCGRASLEPMCDVTRYVGAGWDRESRRSAATRARAWGRHGRVFAERRQDDPDAERRCEEQPGRPSGSPWRTCDSWQRNCAGRDKS